MGRQGSKWLTVMSAALACGWVWTLSAQSADKLVYADFEQVQDGRPVTSRGGAIQIFGYSENTHRPPIFKGVAGLEPAAPELVRVKPDDPNRLAKFDLELLSPNQWSSVVLELKGLPDKDGEQVAEDVSGFKYLSIQVFATGVPGIRVELLSRGQGRDEKIAQPAGDVHPEGGTEHLSRAADEVLPAGLGHGHARRSQGHLEAADLDQRHRLLRRVPAVQGDGDCRQRDVREVTRAPRAACRA